MGITINNESPSWRLWSLISANIQEKKKKKDALNIPLWMIWQKSEGMSLRDERSSPLAEPREALSPMGSGIRRRCLDN